jgi:hypothetical protein
LRFQGLLFWFFTFAPWFRKLSMPTMICTALLSLSLKQYGARRRPPVVGYEF